MFPYRSDKALIYQNYIILLLAIVIKHVVIIRIFLPIDIHQLMFSHTLWYKALKVCRFLSCKHHSTIRLSHVMDSGDPGSAVE